MNVTDIPKVREVSPESDKGERGATSGLFCRRIGMRLSVSLGMHCRSIKKQRPPGWGGLWLCVREGMTG